jgi:hypothetical protein
MRRDFLGRLLAIYESRTMSHIQWYHFYYHSLIYYKFYQCGAPLASIFEKNIRPPYTAAATYVSWCQTLLPGNEQHDKHKVIGKQTFMHFSSSWRRPAGGSRKGQQELLQVPRQLTPKIKLSSQDRVLQLNTVTMQK